ncbi:MAG UNVERIFIED_CONTAM: hypothetical protein LVT10_13940 [Anaerolineae bacterium]
MWQVFVTHDRATALDTLSFVAMQDGNTTTLEVDGTIHPLRGAHHSSTA